jgi:dipeptidyl-peptidase-4
VRIVNLLDNTSEKYPKLIPIHYPKTGETNPSARVGVVPARGGKTLWIDTPGDPRENYICDLNYIPQTGELYLQQLNRLQNMLSVRVVDPETGTSTLVHRDNDDAWIDIEQNLRWIEGGKQHLSLSERDGWRHLYLVDKVSEHPK